MRRLFQRQIPPQYVLVTVTQGEIIEEQFDQDSRRTWLILGFPEGAALHVVVSRDTNPDDCNVVTAYFPSQAVWDETFKRKRQ